MSCRIIADLAPVVQGSHAKGYALYAESMNLLFTIILIVGIVLLIVGGVVEAVRFLLWVGIILAILALILWLLRSVTGKR